MRSISAIVVSMLLASNASAFAAPDIASVKAIHPMPNRGHPTSLQSATIPSGIESIPNFNPVTSFIPRLRSRSPTANKPQEDGLTVKQKLKKAGLPVIMSFGTVSNLSVAGCLSVAWYLFAKQTGLSPLAPQQWKPFMVVYSACMALSRTLTPAIFAGAVAVAPLWEKMLGAVQSRTKLSRFWSNCICALAVNFVGSVGIMVGGVGLAAALAGIPIFV